MNSNTQLSYDDLMSELKEKGSLDIYEECSKNLEPALFFDPFGIHGIAHAKRVLMLSLIISCLNGLNKEDTEILIQASLFHDIGRTHNGKCYVHGQNSYKKAVKLGLIKDNATDDTRILKYIIENHCINDTEGFKNAENFIYGRDRAIELLKLFKDCDNLDRVRLGDLNVKFLRNAYSLRLVNVAEELFKKAL